MKWHLHGRYECLRKPGNPAAASDNIRCSAKLETTKITFVQVTYLALTPSTPHHIHIHQYTINLVLSTQALLRRPNMPIIIYKLLHKVTKNNKNPSVFSLSSRVKFPLARQTAIEGQNARLNHGVRVLRNLNPSTVALT